MRKKVRAFQIFAVAVILSVTGMLLFIQSTSFAKIVKNIVQNRLPKDVGVSADFKDFSILFFPPGIVINKPTIQLAKKNILGLPPDTKLESQRVEVTFQFFQLMTGSVTIRSLNIFGANLRLKLDEEFFEKHEKKLTQKKSTPSNGWQNLLKFSFRSVGLFDSDLNVGVVPSADRPGFSYKGFAKEFTVTKGTYDVPSYEIALNLKDSQIQNASLT